MPFCDQCGAQIQEGAAFCPQCGASKAPAAAPAQPQQPVQPAPQYQQPSQPQQPAASAGAQKQPYAEMPEGEYDPRDIEENKIMAFLAYVIFLIPLFAAKDSKFARFHANQGLLALITDAALLIVYFIIWIVLFFLMMFILPGEIFSLVVILLGLGWLVVLAAAAALNIMGIINALTGKAKQLPVIGKFKIIK